jgi:hypothetical protein
VDEGMLEIGSEDVLRAARGLLDGGLGG